MGLPGAGPPPGRRRANSPEIERLAVKTLGRARHDGPGQTAAATLRKQPRCSSERMAAFSGAARHRPGDSRRRAGRAAFKAAVPALTLSGSAAADFGVLSQHSSRASRAKAHSMPSALVARWRCRSTIDFPRGQFGHDRQHRGEGAWRPITRLETNAGLMTRSWATAITVLSDEFMSFAPNALRLLEAELRKAAIAAVDRTFLAAMTTGAPSSPARP